MARTLVASTTTEVAGTPPNVGLVLTWDTDAKVTVSRRDPDLARGVRGCEPVTVTAGVPVTLADYEAPLSTDVVYEAVDEAGKYAVSGTARNTATLGYPNNVGWEGSPRGAVWLKHLTIPALSMPVDLSNADSPGFKQTRTVLEPLNRRDPIVLADTKRKYPTTTLDVRTWSLEEATSLRRLLADSSVLLLQVPAGERWGLGNVYVAVADVTEERLWQEWAPFEGRVFHLPVEVVERPSGGTLFPACCYWSKQDGQASYLAFDTQYGNYAKLGACDVNAVAPPDPPDNAPLVGDDNTEPPAPVYTVIATATRTTSDGTYGNLATTRTYGTDGRVGFASGGNSATYNRTPLPLLVVTKTVTLVAGDRYTIYGEAFNYGTSPDGGGTVGMQTRVTPGASASVTSGTQLWYREKTVDSGQDFRMDASLSNTDAQFIPDTSGVYTFAFVMVGTIPSVSTSGVYGDTTTSSSMAIEVEHAQTTTTGSPANAVTLSLSASLTSGATYYVSGTQYLKNAAQPVTFTARYVYGTATGTSPGLGVTTAGAATSIGSTPVALNSSGSFQATSTGTWTVVTVVSSSGNVDDATDASGRAAVLSIGTYA